MTLDEISVVFTADTAPFEAAVSAVADLIDGAEARLASLPDSFLQAGVRAGQGLQSGLLSMRGQVAAAAKALANAAADALRGALDIHSPSRVAFALGRQFDAGLTQGISAGEEDAAAAAAGLGGRAAQALGGMLSAPEKAADASLRSLAAAAAAAPSLPLPDAPAALAPSVPAERADQPLSLTVPLEIDGYRLGVAVIEGINRVARGSGRIELTL